MASPSQKLMARHPLQRLPSPSRSTSALVHIAGIISFTLSFKYMIDNPTKMNDSYGWHMQYLTIIGLAIAYATFICAFLADITLSPKLFLIKNVLSLCSAPLAVLISLLYGVICAIDKELVVPPEIDLAPIADIGFHAMPAILLVIDLLFLSPPWTIAVLPAIGLSSVLAVSYWAWVEQCYKYNGFYPYPLFEQLDTTQRSILFTMAALAMAATTSVLKWLYSRVNGTQGIRTQSRPGNIKGE
ncbi:uncharacterized protein BP5553_00006 [Venustampulla echinocandica]|uniref:Integral membrane protein n=1 Tax=Venustampulla echinocandica TaxID=2656787 RepID=A0A370TWX4_9HELO|nr:uncharacterized protein BP5553_00006 [Venustampulla echinocandica]RDL40027.1 hypothetical protein BP5553_00006 [Venustampulla echinocandica]